jgi:hypothetical protein
MGTNDFILLVVIGFFGLVMYSIHNDEQRKADRRRQDLPHPVERRSQERRQRGPYAYLVWGLRAQWSKLTGKGRS